MACIKRCVKCGQNTMAVKKNYCVYCEDDYVAELEAKLAEIMTPTTKLLILRARVSELEQNKVMLLRALKATDEELWLEKAIPYINNTLYMELRHE